MARKKVIFVILEGPSDDAALTLFFERFYSDSSVRVCITYGDITTEGNTNASNVAKRIGNLIKKEASIYGLKKANILGVIHVVDTDGAYIDDSMIKENSTIKGTLYSESSITASNKSNIIKRNTQKKEVLNRLIGLQTVCGGIPYYVFYMSCNLEHVLFDNPNVPDIDKKNLAFSFSKQYKNNLQGFLNFIEKSSFSRVDGYIASWNYIKDNNHSLQRNSNLGLAFSKSMFNNDI